MGIFDFLIKNKNIENENGLNEVYSNNGKGVLEKRFYKKNGKLNGFYEEFSSIGFEQLEERTNYKNGKIHGRKEMYLSKNKMLGETVPIPNYLFMVTNYENGNPTNYREVYNESGSGKIDLENGNRFWYSSKDILMTYDEILLECKKNKQKNEEVIKKLEKYDLQLEQKKVEGTYDNFIKTAKENNNFLYVLYTSQKEMMMRSINENKKEIKPFLINDFAFIKDNNIVYVGYDCLNVFSGKHCGKTYSNGELKKSKSVKN